MTLAWAQRQAELLSDCIVSPNVFDHMVDRLRNFVVPYQHAEDVSKVLMCYSLCMSLQPSTPNVIEWYHDFPGLALSSLSRDRYRPPWSDPARQATIPVPRTPWCRSHLSAGL
jgi:hypothetical protein